MSWEDTRKNAGICLYTGVPMIATGAVLTFYAPLIGWLLVTIGSALSIYCGLIELISTS